MVDPDEHVLDRAGKRFLGTVLGLLFGFAVGVIVALTVVGFGDPGLITIGLGTVGGGVLGYLYPTPFLFVVGLLTGFGGD